MDEPIVGYLAAVLMGLVLGLLGGGGSILTVPILVYLCHASAALASSYSLWIVGVTALVGAVKHTLSQHVSYQAAFIFGLPSLLGVILARSCVLPGIPEQIFQLGGFLLTRDLIILLLFAMLMIAAGSLMITQSPMPDAPAKPKLLLKHLNRPKYTLLIIEGFLVGILTGLVGAGGGFMIVPVLVLLIGLPMRVAIGTSLAIISVKSLAGLLVDGIFWNNAHWRFLLSFTAAAVVGVFLGGLLASKVSTRPLEVGFGWFAVSLGFFMLAKELML